MTNPKYLPAIFLYYMKGQSLLVKCDFSYSCAAADKISTDFKVSCCLSATAELFVLNKTQLQLNEVCYKASLTENFQQQVVVVVDCTHSPI